MASQSQPQPASQSQPQPASHPTFVNLPQPPSNPDTPSEMPGTPTSTTTSLSALSTTAIKDGQRGHQHHGPIPRGHQHTLSSNSLEAERADRISRLAGFSAVQTLRSAAPAPAETSSTAQQSASSPQTTPTSTSGFAVNAANAPGGLTPAYFDAAGQPVAATKISTVGTASATESVGGRTTTETAGDHDGAVDGDEDMLSMDTNYRDGGEGDSVSGYMVGGDAMDEDLTTRSVSGFEDRMSDDGNASLVGFGEGAGSTVSGPIYHRRPLPGSGPSTAGALMDRVLAMDRSSSGLSESGGAGLGMTGGASLRRDTVRELAHTDITNNLLSITERRSARMTNGTVGETAPVADDDIFVDTTSRGPVTIQPPMSAIRETQQPGSQPQQLHTQNQHQRHLQLQLQHAQAQARELRLREGQSGPGHHQGSTSREAVERLIRERLDNGEARVVHATMGSPQGGERLGRFFYEDGKK